MRKTKLKEPISIIRAMEIFSSLSELDAIRVQESLEEGLHPGRWLDTTRIDENEELIHDALDAIVVYLENLQMHDPFLLEEPQTKKGILAMHRIIKEATEKLHRHTVLFDHKMDHQASYHKIETLLQELFPEGFLQDALPIEIPLTEEFATLSERDLDDLQQIRDDDKGELFYIKKEDGKAFYDYECIRRLKWLYDFELLEEHGHESLVRIRLLEAKSIQTHAMQIVQEVTPLLEDLRKEAGPLDENALAAALNKAMFALFCCANPRNLPCHTGQEKEISSYFADFVKYLREAMESREYRRLSAQATPVLRALASLLHRLCATFFLATHTKKEMRQFLCKLTEGARCSAQETIGEELIHKDAYLRKSIESWPNGPLHRTIRAFLRGETHEGWDPYIQGWTPSLLFYLQTKAKEINIIAMASPTQQVTLHEAKIVPEFALFIDKVVKARKEKMLLVDLQDVTSMEEYARTHALELFTRKEPLHEHLSIMRLAKQTCFYKQTEEYAHENIATDFFLHLQEQVASGTSCGFSFPKIFLKEQALFCEKLSSWMYACFFMKKNVLSLRERQDFIELFYFFLTLKQIELLQPKYVAFLSKDGLDLPLSSLADLFFCLEYVIHPQKDLSEEEREVLLWLLYGPILLTRERAIHKEDILRSAHAMETFQLGVHAHREEFLRGFHELFPGLDLLSIEIEESA